MTNLFEKIINFFSDGMLNIIIGIVSSLVAAISFLGIAKIYKTIILNKQKKRNNISVNNQNDMVLKQMMPCLPNPPAARSMSMPTIIDDETCIMENTAEIFDVETKAILSSKNGHINYEIKKSEIIIGRDSTCDLILNSKTISRKHAEITLDGSKLSIRDLGSKNMTHLNNIALQPNTAYELNDKDSIMFAEEEFIIVFVNQLNFTPPDIKIDDISSEW